MSALRSVILVIAGALLFVGAVPGCGWSTTRAQTATTAPLSVAGVSFTPPEGMAAELIDADTDHPAYVLTSSEAFAVVCVHTTPEDTIDARDEALKTMLRMFAERPIARGHDGTSVVRRRIARHLATGFQLVTDEGDRSLIAEVYATAVSDRTVMLLFVYPAHAEARYDTEIGLLATSLGPELAVLR